MLTGQEALRRAAERSQRRVDLENARIQMERTLGYEIGEAQAPWLSLLFHASINIEFMFSLNHTLVGN